MGRTRILGWLKCVNLKILNMFTRNIQTRVVNSRVINYKVPELWHFQVSEVSLASVLHRFQPKSAVTLHSVCVHQVRSTDASALTGSKGALQCRSLYSLILQPFWAPVSAPAHAYMHLLLVIWYVDAVPTWCLWALKCFLHFGKARSHWKFITYLSEY